MKPDRKKAGPNEDDTEKDRTGQEKDRRGPVRKKTGPFRDRPKTGLGPPMCNST